LACVGAGAWVLWALLSAVGARRRVPVIERPPTCETCGYNLTLMPMEARCPECGEPVVNSLGPAVRPGAPWERRGELGRVQTWLSTALVAIARSAWLGRQIRVCSRVVDHRSFCALCLIPSFLAGYCMAIGFDYVQSHGRYGLARSLETPCFVAPILGILSASLALAVVLTAAGVIGLWVGVAHRRNLLPAAMQVAGYLMGLLAFFGLLSAGIAVIMFRAASEHWFAGLRLRYLVDEEFFAFLGWALPTLGLVLIYLALLYRGTREARYANR
jgi:hypothetical protein